jgi:predicted RND superfamily exporter protein
VVEAIVGNQLGSIGWTAALIAVTLLISFRSLRWTAVVMAPIAAATLLLFGALGYAGLPLGIATSMFAALTLGAGVDFALHYCYGYRRERRERRADHEGAVLATVATAGRGVLWNALVLAFGFLVLAFSALKPNASLGLLLAAAMAVSYLATVVFLPELLRRWGRD